jgi:hypothetical protein
MTDPVFSNGIAVDAAGDVYAEDEVVASTTRDILEFAPAANGSAAPTRTIAGSVVLVGLAVDGTGTIYAVMETAAGYYGIEVLSGSASGSATPAAVISSSAWTADEAGIAVD